MKKSPFKLLMNNYYNDFIVEKLKNDIIKDLNDIFDKEMVIKEVNDYFEKNEIVFNETNKVTGTHQIRNRDAYDKKENKCKALVWNEGHGGQCSRSSKNEFNGFCKTHFKKGGEDWFLGTTEKRVERPIDTKGKFYEWLKH